MAGDIMGNKPRVAKWDNVKFILILFVVIGHAMRYYTGTSLGAQRVSFYIYLFHMPAFLFVSGLVSKGTVDKRRMDKVFSYFILFLLMKFTRFLIIPNKSGRMFEIWTVTDVSWYALALLVYCLVTMVCRQFSAAYMLAVSVLAACCIGYAKDVDSFLSLGRIFSFYPFFLAGYYTDSEKLLAWTKRIAVKISAAVVLVISAAVVYFNIEKLFWLMKFLKQRDPYTVLGDMREYGFLFRLGWYGIAFLLTFAVITVIPSVECFITKLGQRTLSVYALHFTVLTLLIDVWDLDAYLCSADGVCNVKLVLLLALLVTCVLSTKPVAWLVDTIVKPKKRIQQN